MSSEFQFVEYRAPAKRRRYFVRLNSAASAASARFGPILEQLMARTRAPGAVLYAFDIGSDEFQALAARSNISTKISEIAVTLGSEASEWLSSRREPLQVSLPFDVPFENLPEVLQYGFRRVLVVPLRSESAGLGFLTLGGFGLDPFAYSAVREAQAVGRIVEAALEEECLRNALRRTA